jgi:Transposase
LERRRIVALLPDREVGTIAAWLAAHPEIGILSRDRVGGYGNAAAKALPHAIQVADRWHLLENASAAFLDAVRKSMQAIRTVIGTATINPEVLTSAEKLQYLGYLRREEANAAIMALTKDGAAIKPIVRRTGHSRGLVRQVIKGQRTDVFRVRQSSLDPICHGWKRNGSAVVARVWRRPGCQRKGPRRASEGPLFSNPKEAIGGSLLSGSRWGCRSIAGSRWRAACVRRRHFLVVLPSTAFVPRVLGCLRSGGCGVVSGCGSIGANGPCGRRGHRILSHCGY